MKHLLLSKHLLETLQLEQLDKKLFRGNTIDIGSPIVFGGQVLAQALSAATQTVSLDRFAHSLHAYFILPGDKSKPIIYEVDTIRDGGSFTTRRVVAIQDGRPIFNFSASFQKRQEGFTHQSDMPKVANPEDLPSFSDLFKKIAAKYNIKSMGLFDENSPIEARPVEDIDYENPGNLPPYRHVWFRWKDDSIQNNPALHRIILAYFSDYNLLTSALLPHNISFLKRKLQIASLDHAMWFHCDPPINEWLLYAIDSPYAGHARGFSRGQIFTQSGVMVASVAQEGMIRFKREVK